jgi:hypothetical protein
VHLISPFVGRIYDWFKAANKRDYSGAELSRRNSRPADQSARPQNGRVEILHGTVLSSRDSIILSMTMRAISSAKHWRGTLFPSPLRHWQRWVAR